jgi:hypothetical protein
LIEERSRRLKIITSGERNITRGGEIIEMIIMTQGIGTKGKTAGIEGMKVITIQDPNAGPHHLVTIKELPTAYWDLLLQGSPLYRTLLLSSINRGKTCTCSSKYSHLLALSIIT